MYDIPNDSVVFYISRDLTVLVFHQQKQFENV